MTDITEYGHLNLDIALLKRSKKLDQPAHSVNLSCVLLVMLLASGCAPPPRPVATLNAPAYGTLLGNQRRAIYEHEVIPTAAPAIVWNTDAGAGMRGTLLLVDSVVLAATTNRQLMAVHRESGDRYWERRFGNAVTTTVLYNNNTIYVATDESDGSLFAMNTQRGRRIWQRTVGPVRFTPLLDRGVLYVGNDAGTVAAIRHDGEPVWRVGLPRGVAETPLDDGEHIVVFTLADSVFKLRKSDGGLVARGALPATPSGAAARSGETIIVPTQDSLLAGIDARTLALQWTAPVTAPLLAAPVVTEDGTAYIVARDGSLYRVRSGQAERLAQLGHAVAGSLTLARDHLLIGSYDGTLIAVTLDGNIVWKFRFNDSIVAPVAVGDGAIYVPLLRGRIVKLR